MQKFIDLINSNQAFLLKRILEYAKRYGYVKYTSTLEEAWIASVGGLSKTLVSAMQLGPSIPEIQVDYDFLNCPIAAFGIVEAQKHRQRGVSLEMFLSLMKYYRQSYLDLVKDTIAEPEAQHFFQLWILRFFDITEIAFCSEWNMQSNDAKLGELQQANRRLTNEKNKYLTIYESTPTSALILDADHRCSNMNYAAQQLLQKSTHAPGYIYYADAAENLQLGELLPGLVDAYMEFYNGSAAEKSFEADFDSPSMGIRNLLVKFRKMLDVSDKFEGTVILLNDMTEFKGIEDQLRSLSFHDQLTGLYNRAYMEEELIRLSSGRVNPVAFISIDIDGLKLVNDNYGHSAGDALLITVSLLLKRCFRKNDVLVRFGGDEFIIILPTCDAETVNKACQKIRGEINKHNKNSANFPISLSIGATSGNLLCSSNSREFLKDADRKMYAEKQTNHPQYETLFWQNYAKTKNQNHA